MTSGHLKWTQLVEDAQAGDTDLACPDKWALFDNLRDGRAVFGVTDRDLAVLNALLSFHSGRALDMQAGLIVFPSNRKLSDRVHGMAESTLRRHLAALVAAGLILRHDSPNGKRYATRGRDGQVVRAFGFDLSPLVIRAEEINVAGEDAREAAAELRLLRDEVSVRLRDVEKLAAFSELTDFLEEAAVLRRVYRRKLPLADLKALLAATEALRAKLARTIEAESQDHETTITSGNDHRSDCHHLISNPIPTNVESCKEQDDAAAIPLSLVREACVDIALYGAGEIETWEELARRADLVRPMLGISPDAWREARSVMGYRPAAAVMAAILQRAQEIRSPGGYLRALTRKAEAGAFSPIPMLVALTNRSPSDGCEKVDSCQLFEGASVGEKS